MPQDEHRKRRHSKTLLYAHMIFVTKFREKLPEKWIWDRIKHEIYRRCIATGISVFRMESDTDHIHLLLEYPPILNISTIKTGNYVQPLEALSGLYEEAPLEQTCPVVRRIFCLLRRQRIERDRRHIHSATGMKSCNAAR